MRIAWLLLLLLAVPSAVRAQAWLDQPGATGAQVAEVGTVRLTLPPGEWTRASDQSRSYLNQVTPLLERTYIQTDGKRVVAVVYLRANGGEASGHNTKGFRPAGSCFRTDVFLNESENVYPGQYNCLVVNHLMMTWDGDPPLVWQETIAKVAPFGGVPRLMIGAIFEMASPDRFGFISVWIYFNPATAGFSGVANTAWRQSEWHRDNATPDHVAYLNKIAAWARAYRKVVAASWN
jgi:hypothetical protein